MLAVVALGEMPNRIPFLWVKFSRSNHQIRRGLDGNSSN
jgi:hypothetical protein